MLSHTVLLVLDFDQFPWLSSYASGGRLNAGRSYGVIFPIFHQASSFSLQNQEKEVIMQGFQSYLELTHPFHPNSGDHSKSQVEPRIAKVGEVDSTSSLGRFNVAKSIDQEVLQLGITSAVYPPQDANTK